MLLDTSGLFCLLHRGESIHGQACAEYRRATFRLTHGFILAEFIALANARRIPRFPVLAFLEDLLANSDIETVWVGEELTNEAISLLKKRQDKTYSLCDAVSFVLMRQRDITEALTTDRHFEQEGFRKLLGS